MSRNSSWSTAESVMCGMSLNICKYFSVYKTRKQDGRCSLQRKPMMRRATLRGIKIVSKLNELPGNSLAELGKMESHHDGGLACHASGQEEVDSESAHQVFS